MRFSGEILKNKLLLEYRGIWIEVKLTEPQINAIKDGMIKIAKYEGAGL